MPKQRKPNNSMRRDQRLFSDCHIFTWEGLLAADGEQYTTAQKHLTMGGWCPMGLDLSRHLLKHPRNWSVAVRALCRTPDGKAWMESRIFDLASHRIDDLQGVYLDLRADVLSAQRTAQVFDMGWIAQTWHGKKPDDSLELWHYYYAPAEVIRAVCNDDRTVRKMAGPGYSPERYDTWQRVNREFLEDQREAA